MLSLWIQCRTHAVDKAESPSPTVREIGSCQLSIVRIKGSLLDLILEDVGYLWFSWGGGSPTCIFRTLENCAILDFVKINFICFLPYLVLDVGFFPHNWQI